MKGLSQNPFPHISQNFQFPLNLSFPQFPQNAFDAPPPPIGGGVFFNVTLPPNLEPKSGFFPGRGGITGRAPPRGDELGELLP